MVRYLLREGMITAVIEAGSSVPFIWTRRYCPNRTRLSGPDIGKTHNAWPRIAEEQAYYLSEPDK